MRFKRLVKKIYRRIYKGKYYKAVNIVCNNHMFQAHFISNMLENMLRKNKMYFQIYGRDSTYYIDSKYEYIKVRIYSFGDPYKFIGKHDEYFLLGDDVEKIIELNNPKKAFKELFEKRIGDLNKEQFIVYYNNITNNY